MSQRKGETREQFLERNRRELRERYAADRDFRRRKLEHNKSQRRGEKRAGFLTRSRRWSADRQADPERRARKNLTGQARKHGIAPETLAVLLAGGCGICGRMEEANGKSLHVDHDHECCPYLTGGQRGCGECVRGVLCSGCNTGFEKFADSPRVIAYLRATAPGRRTLDRLRVEHHEWRWETG